MPNEHTKSTYSICTTNGDLRKQAHCAFREVQNQKWINNTVRSNQEESKTKCSILEPFKQQYNGHYKVPRETYVLIASCVLH